jgi:hypothetical protein
MVPWKLNNQDSNQVETLKNILIEFNSHSIHNSQSKLLTLFH